jgi:hypothetical protein
MNLYESIDLRILALLSGSRLNSIIGSTRETYNAGKGAEAIRDSGPTEGITVAKESDRDDNSRGSRITTPTDYS